MSESGRLGLPAAVPADLADLEIFELKARPAIRPPYVAASFGAFERAPERGQVLIIEDGGQPVGFAVLAMVWSNRRRGEIAVIDDICADPDLDEALLRLELRRHALARGCVALFHHADDAMTEIRPR